MDWAAQNRQGILLMQAWLQSRGLDVTIDGKFGPRTEAKFRAASGFRGASETAEALKIGHGFTGSLDLLRQFEGYKGRPYWPGKASGVTLDPGVDLGYVDPALVLMVYGEATYQRCVPAFGIQGRAAERIAKSPPLSEIRVSRWEAHQALPEVARPYWQSVSMRWPGLATAPAPAQSACLSIAYNRGAWNGDTASMGPRIAAGDWIGLARIVERMQQNRDDGIPARRKAEAALIRSAV